MEPNASFSAARRAQLEELCDDLIERALRVHAAFHGSASALDAWKLVRRRDALSVYRLRHEPRALDEALNDESPAVLGSPSSSSSSASEQRARARSRSRSRGRRQRLLLGSGIVRGSADDAIAGVYCDSTEQLRVVKRLINDSFIDGAVLHVFERNPLHAPVVFSGIKWFALKGFGNGQLVRDRDFLTYERMGRILDHRSGQVFTYQVLQSIDLPERPANRDNVARAHMSWCYLYRQLDEDWLGCFMLGDLDIGGGMDPGPKLTVPRPIDDYVSAERLLTVANFRVVVRARAFSRLIASSADLLPSESTKHCDRCMSSVTKFLGQSLTLCMGCKKNVCRTCRHRETVFRLKTRTGKPEREYFCRGCVDSVDGMRAPMGSNSIGSSGYSNSMPTSEHYGARSHQSRRRDTNGREQCGVSSPSSASSLSPTQEWSELDDDFQSDDEDGAGGYMRSYHADDKELRKLASFTRRCSMVEDAQEPSDNQRATSRPIPGGIWWNPKEMERLARYLNKEKRRERRRRGDTDYDRPRSFSDRHYGGAEGSAASSHPRGRGTDSLYSGVSSYGTDQSAYEAGRDAGGAPPLAPIRSFVVYDEALQDFVRLHNPERPTAVRPSQPAQGSMFSVDELD